MKKIFAILMLAIVAGYVMGEGSVVKTYNARFASVKHVSVAWTAGTNGVVNATVEKIDGKVERIVFEAMVATNEVDITLKGADGVDIMRDQGLNVSNALVNVSADNADTSLPIMTVGDLTLLIQNAPASTNGTFHIYWR